MRPFYLSSNWPKHPARSLLPTGRRLLIHGSALVVILGCLNQVGFAQKLTDVTMLSTGSNGSESGSQYWDTHSGAANSVFDLWVVAGTPNGTPNGLTGSFLNGPSDSLVPVGIQLQLGANPFTIYGSGGGVSGYHGMNLFFDGGLIPGISVTAATRTGAAIPDFFANSGAKTLDPAGGRIPGAGTLTTSSGGRVVKLTDFYWAAPSVFGIDRVSPYNAMGNGGNDFVGTFTLLVSAAPATDAPRYDASLGTFPSAQGFFAIEEKLTLPAILTNGALHTFSTMSRDGVQFYLQTIAPLDFSTNSYAAEATLHIISANYTKAPGDICCGGQRSGYYLNFEDSQARLFAIGLSSTGIVINTRGNFDVNEGVTFKSFNTTDRFHTYRFVIDKGNGSLFIDGLFFASLPAGQTGVGQRSPSVSFGDASGVGVSEAELREFSFAPAPISPHLTIEASDVRVCWPSLASNRYQLQYRSELTTNGWVNIGTPVQGTGETNCLTDAVSGPQHFYQLLVLP